MEGDVALGGEGELGVVGRSEEAAAEGAVVVGERGVVLRSALFRPPRAGYGAGLGPFPYADGEAVVQLEADRVGRDHDRGGEDEPEGHEAAAVADGGGRH